MFCQGYSSKAYRALFMAFLSVAFPSYAISDVVECVDAPPLPKPSGKVVNINDEAELQRAVGELESGTTLLLSPGTYSLTSTLYIRTSNVTIRGDSTSCDAVRLIGRGMENANYGEVAHGIWTDATGLAVQNLGISDVYFHAINFNPGAGAPQIYNVRLTDTGQQFVKANPLSFGNGVDDGVVEYSIFEYTEAPPKTDHGGGTGYTNGVDVHAGSGWVIRNNVFKNFHTPDSADNLWNPAVLIWNGAEDTTVENNIFINVDRAIAFGLGARADDHSGGIIRNNMLYYSPNLYSSSRRAESDGAIIVWDSRNTKVYHNTVLTNGNLNRSIEFRFNTSGAEAKNNIVDKSIGQRNEADFVSAGNVFNADPSWFSKPSAGDLHLRSEMMGEISQVQGVSAVPLDIDGQSRSVGGLVYPGADEPTGTSPPFPPSDVQVQ